MWFTHYKRQMTKNISAQGIAVNCYVFSYTTVSYEILKNKTLRKENIAGCYRHPFKLLYEVSKVCPGTYYLRVRDMTGKFSYLLHQLFHFCMLQPFIFNLLYTFSSVFTVVQKEIDNKRTIRSIEKGPILNRKTPGLVKLHSCTQTSRLVQINTFASENKVPGTYCTH